MLRFLSILLVCAACARPQAATIPDMPAGHTLRAGSKPLTPATGLDKSERLHIEFRVQEKARPTIALGKIDVSDADPEVVISFSLLAIPPGMTADDMNITIDDATKARVIDGAVAKLNEF